MSGRRPHGPRPGLRLLLAAFGAVVGVLLTGATGAFGYWLAVSAGNPSAAAADALPIGAPPSAATTPSANSTTVAITFAAASTSLGNVAIPAGNYTLRRYPTVGAPVPVTATCTGITTITCTASNVPDGTWQYTDTPTYGLDWVGTESAKSASVVVDATPPVVPVPSVASGYVTVLSVPVGLGTVTDTGGSGVNASTVTVLRASATLSAGTCGTFSSFAPVTLTGGNDTTVLSGLCYQYQQRATDNVGNTTTSTPSNAVKVDNTAPASAVTFPVASGSYNNTSWTAGCTAKLCGTASDTGSGVAQVQVSVQSNTGTTSGKYWNGTAFASATEVKSPASLAGGTWTLAFPSTNFPADGSTYTVRAYATDTAGNTQTTPTTTFTIDANAPTITGLTLAGGAARKIEWGDKITITFSEQMRASSLCSSWTTGTDSDTRTLSSNVSVAIGNGTAPVTGNDYLTVTATGCSFGTLDLGSGQYVTGQVTFTNTGGNGSTVQWNGSTSTLTITLGKVATGTTRIRASVPDSSPTYGNSSIQDSAGNPLSAPSFTLPSGPQF
jgi:hypothetical protein